MIRDLQHWGKSVVVQVVCHLIPKKVMTGMTLPSAVVAVLSASVVFLSNRGVEGGRRLGKDDATNEIEDRTARDS